MKRIFLKGLSLLLSALLLCACASPGGGASRAGEGSSSAVGETKTEKREETGEGKKEESEAEGKSDSGSHEVLDHAGNRVMVPNEIRRVVVDQVPILSTYMAYFKGKTPYLVGFAGSFKDSISKTVLKDIAPELMDVSNTVYAQGDLNVEAIMELKPDIILYNAGNKEHYEALSKTGIPCVGFATVKGGEGPPDPLTRYRDWLRLLEEVFGEKGKMDDFLSYGDEIVKDVRERIAAIPEGERPSAMILFRLNNGSPQVAGKGVFGDFWLRNLGLRNVAEETQGFAQTSFEQIYGWNPELLFLDGPGISPIRSEEVLNNTVEGTDFSSLDAVKNKRVYNTTLGMWNWFTPNPDAPLVYAWLACCAYPEAFRDYPLKEKIRDYYSRFYGYELNEAEIEEMLEY